MTQLQQKVREDIITMFDIDKLPPEQQEEMISSISKIIFQSVLMRVVPTMSTEDQKEYEGMIGGNVAPDKLMSFFFEKVPNFLEIIAEEAEDFKKTSSDMLSKIA